MRSLRYPVLIFCLLLCLFFLLIHHVCADILPSGAILHSIRCEGQPISVPTWQIPATGEGDIMIDNFEYWDSPYNHGWRQIEPFYPVYGFGMGYSIVFGTLFDFSQGNRVLDVYRPPSVFLLNTPYVRHTIFYDLYTPPSPGGSSGQNYIDLNTHPIVSFKYRAPFGFEFWDVFEFDVICKTAAGYEVEVQVKPLEPPYGTAFNGGSSTDKMGGYRSIVLNADSSGGGMAIEVDIGRNYADGNWHVVWLDLREVVHVALDGYDGAFGTLNLPDWEVVRATRIMAKGQMFRLDNVCFRQTDHLRIDQPDFFECGPRYAQIFEPYRYLFMADYQADMNPKMLSDFLLDPENFITDSELIREIWIADLLALEPDYHEIDANHPLYDPNYTNRWIPGDPNFGQPDRVAERFIRDGFFIDITLPVFSDPNLRIGGGRVNAIRNHGVVGWNMTVGSYGENAIEAFMIEPLPINPYDGMPTYIPCYYRTIEVIKVYGKSHYGPPECYMLESALWNIGLDLWPNIVYMDYEPQYFEDLIVTLQVTNGHNTDVRTFPISVVNFPVENYPPVIQLHVTNRITYVGEKDEYTIRFADPDCFIFSLAQFADRMPSTSHLPMCFNNQIRRDQEALTYHMTLEGLTSYQFGPWMQDMINPHNGLITITPAFEGAFRAIVSCTDQFGTTAYGSFTYYTFNKGTWLNHPPISFGNPTRPTVARAGEEIILNYPDFKVMDPDGDEIFCSANLGAVGRTADGGFMWSFQTNFPGTYQVEIIFYDLRGGYLIRRLTVEIKPWWSF